MTLQKEIRDFYVIQQGDTVQSVCLGADVSERAFIRLNGKNLRAGQLVFLPPRGNLYTVQAGDTAEKLCGSVERFERLNGTQNLYIGMQVRI